MHRRTDRTTTVTLAALARRGLTIHAVMYQAAELGEGRRAAVAGSRAAPSMGQMVEGSWAGPGREQRGEGSQHV